MTVMKIATGEIEESDSMLGKDPKKAAAGSAGGRIGGPIRATRLPPVRRRAIAQKAAQRRWGAPVKKG